MRREVPSVDHGCPSTRHETIMALGRAETAEQSHKSMEVRPGAMNSPHEDNSKNKPN